MNDNFDIFDQLTEKDIVFTSCIEQTVEIYPSSECSHENFTRDKNVMVCISCGECIQKIFNQDRDWKSQQIRNNQDDKNIFKDVENIQFSENILQIANSLYVQVTKEKIYRGNARKGIISACIFHSYKIVGKPQIYKKIIRLFNISKKIGLKGLKFVSINAPKDSIIFRTYITPITYIEHYMEKLHASEKDITYLKQVYEHLESISENKLNRSRPQSVAAGLVYYWLIEQKKQISLKTFSKVTELSELTITKLEKDIRQIMTIF